VDERNEFRDKRYNEGGVHLCKTDEELKQAIANNWGGAL